MTEAQGAVLIDYLGQLGMLTVLQTAFVFGVLVAVLVRRK